MIKYRKDIHIGKLIEQQIALKGISFAEFARQLSCHRTTVYSIIRCKSVDIDRLIKISSILDYDFITNVYLSKDDGYNKVQNIKITLPAENLDVIQGKKIDYITIIITFKE